MPRSPLIQNFFCEMLFWTFLFHHPFSSSCFLCPDVIPNLFMVVSHYCYSSASVFFSFKKSFHFSLKLHAIIFFQFHQLVSRFPNIFLLFYLQFQLTPPSDGIVNTRSNHHFTIIDFWAVFLCMTYPFYTRVNIFENARSLTHVC